MSTPSDALAAHIIDRLVGEGLIVAKDAKAALPKFASGTLTSEDWRVIVENALNTSHKEARK